MGKTNLFKKITMGENIIEGQAQLAIAEAEVEAGVEAQISLKINNTARLS